MIKVYTVMACSSCKKAKEWLTNHELEFEEINLITDKIDPEDFLKIFSLTPPIGSTLPCNVRGDYFHKKSCLQTLIFGF